MMRGLATNAAWLVDATICSTMVNATATITSLEIPDTFAPLFHRKLMELMTVYE